VLSPNNQIGADSSAPVVKPADSGAAASSASDFQSFLKLLTAQLRNQDPLSPIDSTQFIAQLASFSSVEQQVATNTKLDALVANLVGSNLENATQWIGKEVEIASNAARFDGEPLLFSVPESGVVGAQVAVEITDAGGSTVYTEALAAGATSFTWDGKTSSGGIASNDDYQVSINYSTEGVVAETKDPIVLARVTEARLVDSSVKLVLESGAVVDPAKVLAVRDSSI
jgi:flagellar basal-body rod modification protein FlgD